MVKMQEKPNLFNFATSELSQDAIICWLISWAQADLKSSDPVLNGIGKEILNSFYRISGKPVPKRYYKIEINKQYRNIDVMVIINSIDHIIIEDKVGTKEHSNQLERYRNSLIEEKNLVGNLICIYFQTGEQCSYENVRNEEYHTFLREDFLHILDQFNEQITNHILLDYYTYLKELDGKYNRYKDRHHAHWCWHSWQGFFKELQQRLGTGEWSYVPNPSGGFWGFYWYWRKWNGALVYLQLEKDKLCFKIEVKDKSLQSRLRNEYLKLLTSENARLQRPARLGHGIWMTVSTLKGGYIHSYDNGIINWSKTMSSITEAESILESALKRS